MAQAFYISQNGSWPNESYTISLCANVINPSNGPFPVQNYLRYLNNPTNETTSLANFSFNNSTPTVTDGGVYKLQTTNNTNFVWSVGTDRTQNDLGYTINSFYIDSTPNSSNSNSGQPLANKLYYSYLLFPSRLVLQPTAAPYYSGGNWYLNTITSITSASSFYYSSTGAPNAPAVAQVYNYLNSVPSTGIYTPPGSTITYNLCASRTRVEVPIISFTNNYNPYYYSTIVENAPYGLPSCSIRPYSTFLSFENSFYYFDGTNNNLITLGQKRPDTIFTTQRSFDASYILVQNTAGNIQTFQLIQIKNDNTSNYLSSSQYCVLSAVATLSSSNIKYYSNNYQAPNLSIVNNLTGVPNTFIGFTYIADCPTFALSNETWQSTFYGTTNANLGVPSSSNYVTWQTKYPPHYYSYKATVTDASTAKETANLTFSLASSALSATYTNTGAITSVTLYNYIASDYNIVNYDYSNVNLPNDYIKFNPNTESPTILNSLSCYYGSNLNIPYSLSSPSWIPAASAVTFLISYPVTINGEINFSIRPSLSSLAGQLDAYNATFLNLAKGYLPYNPGQKIFISKIQEKSDYIEVDSSFLNSVSSWPTRDLTNSYISWTVTPTSSNVNICSVDLSGNYVQTITPNVPTLWNSNTWSVVVSGYGPVQTMITLSSEKYNETAYLSSVPSLFNYFAEGKILVTPLVALDNYNYVRTITLQASVPYKGRTYNLPNNSLLNWTWTYDFNNSYNINPISAYDVFSNYYPYGSTSISQNISSIQVNVVPEYSDNSPKIHNVAVIANVDTPKGLLQGTYNFLVDDFPSPNIFNTNFYVYYTQYQNVSGLILSTGNGNNTITRPNLSFNNYTFIPYNQVYTIFNSNSSSLVWSLSTTESSPLTSSSGLTYQYNILNPSTAILSLCALNATAPGWTSAHNVQTSVNFYIINYQDFFVPLSFITYPEYFWENGQFLALSDTNNYTLALAPTAYANKVSNTQGFYVSANKNIFTDYEYLVGSTNTTITPVNSSIALIQIPYSNELTSISGVPISLSAFNTTSYPKNNGVTFTAPINGAFITLPYNITAQTLPYNFPLTGSQTAFNRPPSVVPYNQVTFSYSPVLTSILLDNQTVISVSQTVSTNPLNAPAQPVGGTVVYTLSTFYWTVKTSIPAVNGTFDLFTLNVGDAAVPLTLTGLYNNTLTLGASANISVQIPPSTFANYPDYIGDENLWNTTSQIIVADNSTINANLTAVIPQVYISQYYALTGENLFVQYETPYLSEQSNIVAYITNFGENAAEAIRVSAFDETLNYQYKNSGTYYISYSAIFSDNSVSTFQVGTPIVITNSWNTFNPNTLRKVENATLNLPYTQNEILIQPNEFGDADIFNTCITRVQACLDYLKNNLITLNTNSPTNYFGWLGCNSQDLASGIKWHTDTFYANYYLFPNFAVSTGTSFFTEIRDVKETQDHIFVLDGTNLRTFSAGKIPMEISLRGISELPNILINPTSIEVDETQSVLFVADPPSNRIYRFDLDLYQTIPDINPALDAGGLGNRFETNKFNSPSELAYANKKLYVLDYNNYCIKELNTDLSWTFTYFIDEFLTDQPVNIAVHPVFNYLYVLGASNTVYVFDEQNTNLISSFSLNQIVTPTNISKIIFDSSGDFVYVVTSSAIYKYSSDGYYITTLNLPSEVTFTGGKQSLNQSLLFFGTNFIVKVQDVLELYSVGSGVPTEYWSNDQLMVSRDEFSSDLNYNRSLVRLAQNLKTFRSSLNARLVLATEQTATNIITYFAIAPLSVSELPTFDNSIEMENIGVGVNELHVPQTLNKELVKFYEAVLSLTSLLNITNYNVNGNANGCSSQFCWSWKATSCYSLTLPAVRICSVNPITYAELEANFPVSYAPTKVWSEALSTCCSNVVPPV
jgi:hypothetical protein